MREAEAVVPIIGIVVKRWPRLSETFVLNEILGLERAGLRLRIYALMDPHEPASQAAINEVQAPVSYLRTGTRADLRVLLVAQLALLRTAPWRYLRTLGYVLARRRHRSTFIHLFEAARLVALLRKDNVSHIHAQFAHGPTSVAHFASLLGDVSFSFTGHAKDIYLSPPDLLAVKIAAAQFVATCTAHNVAHLRELAVPADRAKIHLVYHGVATERFCPAPGTKDLGASPETASPIRMMAVGRLVEKKGYTYLIRACALLRQRGCCYTLAIYGSGPQRDELARLIDALGLGDIVQLQGSRTQEELITLYREADLFVLSPQILADGDRDAIPNVLMEAMSVGLPVVATDVSGIPELIEDDRSGLLVPPCDEVALSEALERLLDPCHGHALRARLGSAGRERVIQHFDAALHLRRMLELLDTENRRDRGFSRPSRTFTHRKPLSAPANHALPLGTDPAPFGHFVDTPVGTDVSPAHNGQPGNEKPLSAPANHVLPVDTNSVPKIPTLERECPVPTSPQMPIPEGEPTRQEQLQVEGGRI